MKRVHWIVAGVIAMIAVTAVITSVTADERVISSETGAELVLLSREKAEQIRGKLEELSGDLRNDTEWQDEIIERVQEKMEQAIAEVREITEGMGSEDDDEDEIREVAEGTEALEIIRELTFDPELMGLAAIVKLQETAELESAPKAKLLEKALAQTRNHGLRSMIRCALSDLYRDMDQTDKYIENALELLAENDELLEGDEDDEDEENQDGSGDEEEDEDHDNHQ